MSNHKVIDRGTTVIYSQILTEHELTDSIIVKERISDGRKNLNSALAKVSTNITGRPKHTGTNILENYVQYLSSEIFFGDQILRSKRQCR